MAIALVVEDGTGKPDANSYVDLAYADEYLSMFPDGMKWLALTDDQRTAALIRASDSLDHYFTWKGQKKTAEQGLDWPRIGATDCDDYPVSSDAVPVDVEKATCEFAMPISQTSSVANPVATMGITEIQVDVIQLKFDKDTVRYSVPSDVINRLKCLGAYGDAGSASGIRFARAIRT